MEVHLFRILDLKSADWLHNPADQHKSHMHVQGGRVPMTIFEMNAIQLFLEILEWNERQFVAKDGKFYW